MDRYTLPKMEYLIEFANAGRLLILPAMKKTRKRFDPCYDIKSMVFILICSLVVLRFVLPDACMAESSCFYAKVVRVIDGDTIEIQKENKHQRVRIWGVDTPEWDQPYGAQSSHFAKNLLNGQEVQVVPKSIDKYGRLVAVIMMERINIGEELVKSGLAWVHIYFCNEQICDTWKAMQERAGSERRGLWSDRDPVAPWQWRKSHHY